VVKLICKGALPSDEDLSFTIALLVRALRSKKPGAFDGAADALGELCMFRKQDARQLILDAGALPLLLGPLHLDNMARAAVCLAHKLLMTAEDEPDLQLLGQTEGLLPALVAALQCEHASYWVAKLLSNYAQHSDEQSVLRLAQMDGALKGLVRALSFDFDTIYSAASAQMYIAENSGAAGSNLIAEAGALPAIAAALEAEPVAARSLAPLLTTMALATPSLAVRMADTECLLDELMAIAMAELHDDEEEDAGDIQEAVREALRTIARQQGAAPPSF